MVTVFLAGVAVAANRFKVPPVMQSLMADLSVNRVTAGWLMSISSVAMVVLALPAAFALTRLGLKVSGLLALGCTIIGAAIGALAGDSATLLLGRTIEGIGGALIGIVGPAAISAWFQPQERGVPMGIWAAWVPLGNVLIFNAAHPIQAALGWQATWWFGAILALLAFALTAVILAEPPGFERAGGGASDTFARRLRNRSTWLLAVIFGTFGFSLISYNTWAPSYLTETLSIAPAVASFYASLMFMAAIPGNIIAGWALNRTQHRYRLLFLTFAATTILFAGSFHLGSLGLVGPYMILLGFVSNFIPTAVFTLAPETMDHPAFAGQALAIATMGSGLGALLGPPTVGAISGLAGWAAASLCLVVVSGCGTAVAFFAARQMENRNSLRRF